MTLTCLSKRTVSSIQPSSPTHSPSPFLCLSPHLLFTVELKEWLQAELCHLAPNSCVGASSQRDGVWRQGLSWGNSG